MISVIKEILSSPAGSFSFVFGLLVLVCWLVHYVTKFTTKISVEHGQINKRMDKTESSIDEIRRDISFIKGSFEAAIGIKDAIAKKKSPLSLTELGVEIAEKYSLETMIASNWGKINDILNALKTKNPYDIQEYCIETAFIEANKFFSDKDIDKLKIISYKTGVPLFSISRLMGILIRDRYFAENGINVDDVDKSAPNIVEGNE